MIKKEIIDFNDLNIFSDLIKDYKSKKKEISQFISSFPTEEAIIKQIRKKKLSKEIRLDLVKSLKKQYKKTEFINSDLKKINYNIDSLISENTFTITAGHQLNLFSNPLFLIYKVVNIINLSSKISKSSKKNVIPIFWLASEDNDFEEINSFNFLNKNYKWKKKYDSSPVGNLKTKSLKLLIENIFSSIKEYPYKKDLKNIVLKTHLKNHNLSNAIRSILTYFFHKYGLLVLDSNDVILKNHFKPYFKSEINNQFSFHYTTKQSDKLSSFYKTIIKPREINLFYFNRKKRLRIVKNDQMFHLVNGEKKWSKNQILKEINDYPERFSPNVILRTLFQESILPNIAYVGGPTEISYWLQFKYLFDKMKIQFPILVLRSFVLNLKSEHSKFLSKNKINLKDLFLSHDEFVYKSFYKKTKINLKNEIEFFDKIKYSISKKTKKIDSSLNIHSLAICKKIEKDLKKLERKVIKYQKKNYSYFLDYLTKVHLDVYTKNVIQERRISFFEFYLKHGDKFFKILFKKLNCLENGYIILKGF